MLLCVLVVAYEIVPTAVAGVTFGKALFGLRLRRRPGDRIPDWLAAVARAIVLYAPEIFFGSYGAVVVVVLLVSVALPRSGRGLHDRLVGTTVVSIADRA